ncbi:MAG TPA: NAD-dependent epimerase/dehydratase family protein [Hyphomonadaceae bacterium]|nr:NAD-dependent epimerase/dehydratase family protein [Hyphomonadaceae bacterium]HPN05620.1 NAD-dependent epimerase/dehydratase family protein [Hyphomonadaceae bacterium]
MADTVLVTGGTGYVGGWVIVELLKRGYNVHTTVRSLAREGAVRAAVGTQVDPGDRLSFAAADLSADEGWDAAVAGCAYVLHVASPLGQGSEKDPDALVKPAREGTLRVLRAAVKAGTKRIVLTSSCGAATPVTMGVNTVTDEETWSDPSKQDPYRRSKTLAEKAAWEFMRAEGGSTEFTTILPSGVFGPVLSQEGLGSVQFIQRIFDGRLPRIPNVGLNIIDVRDLAVAHVDAMTAPGAAGQRLIVSGDFMWMKDIAAVLKAKLGAQGDKVSTKELPDFVVKLGANFNPALNTLKPLLRRSHRFSSEKARRLIGLKTRPAEDTVIDCARSLLPVA